MSLTENTLKKLRMANLGLKILVVAIICSFLYAAVAFLGLNKPLSAGTFLPIHTIIEFFCVFVALCTFTVTWYSYLNNCSYYSYFIGLGLLAVGLIDLFHLYSYEGMPGIFSDACVNSATLYHIFGRLFMGATFLASVYLYKKEFCITGRMRFLLLTGTLLLVGFILSTVSLAPSIYPIMYVDGSGLTYAKVLSEYFIILVLLVAMVGYLFLYKKYMDSYLQLIICTLLISIFSEVCFISYKNVYETANVLGHLFRFASYTLIYAAIFMNNVKKPYLKLVAAREELANINNSLEERVRERTYDLQKANKILSRAATHDYLTDASNRMEFSNRFKKLMSQPQDHTVHSVIAIDFDCFKNINDTYGHAVGDECLKSFVREAKKTLRPTDTVSRFGGDEFMLLLPNTPKEGAKVAAEKIKKHLAEFADPPFTVSFGVAEWPKDGRKEKELLAKADEALYLAKEKGKNRIE